MTSIVTAYFSFIAVVHLGLFIGTSKTEDSANEPTQSTQAKTSLSSTTATSVNITSETTKTHKKTDKVILTLFNFKSLECSITSTTIQSTTWQVTWMRNGKIFHTANIKTTSSTYSVSKIDLKRTPDEIGTYVCIITQEEKKLYSNNVSLQPFLNITSLIVEAASLVPMETNADVGNIFTAACLVRSFPEHFNFTFQREGVPLKESKTKNIMKTSSENATRYELSIDHLSSADVGVYTCGAETVFERKTVDARRLSTTGNVPNAPQHVRIVHFTHDAIEIRWDKENTSRTSTKLTYSIEVAFKHGKISYFETLSNVFNKMNLKNNTKYEFTIRAKNENGKSEGVKVSCTTKRMVKPSKVGFSSLSPSGDEFFLSWEPSQDDGMENIAGVLKYHVKYCLLNNSNCREVTTSKTSVSLNDILKNTNYRFEITPVNTAGQMGTKIMVIHHTYFKRNWRKKRTENSAEQTRTSLCFVASLLIVFNRQFLI